MIQALFLGGGAALLLAGAVSAIGGQGSGGARRQAALGLVMAGALSWITTSAIVLADDSSLTFQLYHLTPQLEIAFHLDRLAAFFILIVSSVAACVAIYSFKYVEHTGNESRRDMSVAAMSVFILSMVLVVGSANFFAFIFFWELMSLSSLFLVMFDREKAETAKAGIYYLVMTQFSTLFLLLGALLLHRYTGTFDITSAGGLTLSTAGIIFTAFFIGFGTKAGVKYLGVDVRRHDQGCNLWAGPHPAECPVPGTVVGHHVAYFRHGIGGAGRYLRSQGTRPQKVTGFPFH